jgi:DNA-binding CsgD family transcriptional regulator
MVPRDVEQLGPDRTDHLGDLVDRKPVGVPVSGALIGRTAELAQIGKLLDAAATGRGGGGLLLHGAAGIGKSRLLSEAARIATEQGLRVAHARCLPLTVQLPFDPVLELTRSLGATLTPVQTGPDVFGLVVQRLERAILAGPCLLCIDDVQWSDAASLELIRYCLTRLADLPLTWLLAARSDPLPTAGIMQIEQHPIMQLVELNSFSRGETRRLTEIVLGRSSVSETVVDAVHRRTGGNPFLCVELLHGVSIPDDHDGDWDQRAATSIAAVVPERVNEAVEDRIGHLSPAAGAALEWAAVLPERFTASDLDAVGGPGIGLATTELANAGVLVSDPDGHLRFAHAIIHDAVYRRLPQAEIARRHGVVVDRLTGMSAEQLAPQLARARRFDAAATAYMELARQSLDRGQGQDAVKLYEQAAELGARAEDDQARREASAGRVLALIRAGAGDSARTAATSVRAALRDGGDDEQRLRFLSRYATEMMLMQETADIDSAQDAIAEAEPLIAQAHGAGLADALATRAWLRLRTGEHANALADCIQAQACAPKDDRVLNVRVLNVLGIATGLARSAVQAIPVLEQARDLALTTNLPAEAARACANLAFVAEQAKASAETVTNCERGLEIQGAPPAQVAGLRCNLGVAYSHMGDLDTSLAHLLSAVRDSQRLTPLPRARTMVTLAYTHMWRGEHAAVKRVLESDEVAAIAGADVRTIELRALLAEAAGDHAAALASFREGIMLGEPVAMRCELGVARTAVALGDVAGARAALERISELAERWPVGAWMLAETSGWVAVGEHREDDAVTHFTTAADRCSRAYDAARLRLEAGRLSQDQNLVRAAIDQFSAMGAQRGADHARAIARQLGIKVGRPQNRSGLLSTREQEIAQLIASGQTNTEIAGALFLSTRTVERHVGNILAKLDYRSRVEIAINAAAGRLPGGEWSDRGRPAPPGPEARVR